MSPDHTGVMNGVIINHHLEPGIPLSRRAGLKTSEQFAEQGVGAMGCDTIQQGTARQVDGPRQVVFSLGPGVIPVMCVPLGIQA